MSNKIKCDHQDLLTCPYCGYKDEDSWELPEEVSGDGYGHICDHCGKQFQFTSDTSRTFNSSKADCLNGGEHEWKPILGYADHPNAKYCQQCGKREWK
jgi:hypothetical protein